MEEQQDNGQCVDEGCSEGQNLISNVASGANEQKLLNLQEEVRLKTDKVLDLEQDLQSKCVKVIRLENELKNKEELHADLEVKFKEVNQKLHDLEEKKNVLLLDLYQTASIAAKMENDDKQTHFFTGLPSYNTFTVLLSVLSPIVGKMGNVGSGLSMADELVLVLTKLSRGVTNEDLGGLTKR